jgi:hypothetical protein
MHRPGDSRNQRYQLVKRSQGVHILRVFCSSEAPLHKGVAESPSFLFKRGASLQGGCRYAEFSISK